MSARICGKRLNGTLPELLKSLESHEHLKLDSNVRDLLLVEFYGNLRLYVSFFQPSFKLLRKHREARKLKKTYVKPATPCDRLLAHPDAQNNVTDSLCKQRARLDPIVLLHQIRLAQSALVSLNLPGTVTEVKSGITNSISF